MHFEGDILISQFDDENFDIKFTNGQPEMTKGLENLIFLYVFGEDSWFNEIVNTDDEKMQSEFPEIVARATVTDNTLSQATTAIKNALQPLISNGISSTVDVFGQILSAHRMGWQIDISEPINGDLSKYYIIWDKGIINSGTA